MLLAKTIASVPLNWLGEHSIVVYLAFFLPMAVSRAILFKLGIVTDIGTIALLVTACGIVGPVLLYMAVQWSRHRPLPLRTAGLGTHRPPAPPAARGDGAGRVAVPCTPGALEMSGRAGEMSGRCPLPAPPSPNLRSAPATT